MRISLFLWILAALASSSICSTASANSFQVMSMSRIKRSGVSPPQPAAAKTTREDRGSQQRHDMMSISEVAAARKRSLLGGETIEESLAAGQAPHAARFRLKPFAGLLDALAQFFVDPL